MRKFASQLQTGQPLSPTYPSQQKKSMSQETGHLNVCHSVTFSINERQHLHSLHQAHKSQPLLYLCLGISGNTAEAQNAPNLTKEKVAS
jgi:hypothetical protein